MAENRATLDKAVFTFFQEANTNGSTHDDTKSYDDQFEDLEITLESCVGSLEKDGGFYVLRTKSGWSINDSKDLEELFNQIKKIKYE